MRASTLPRPIHLFLTLGCLLIGSLSAHAQGGCIPPTVVIAPADEVRLCLGDGLVLDGSSSVAALGHTVMSFEWTSTGEDPLLTPIASIDPSGPGGYWWYLTVTDDIGCTGQDSVLLLVAPPPSFSDVPDTLAPICLGDTAALSASNIHPGLWTGLPTADLGAGIALPDDVGMFVLDTIQVPASPVTEVLTSMDQLVSVFVDIEHSYMGDLVIRLICPNGQELILHEQGGGGTYLGDANDFDDAQPVPGIGMQYHWSPNALLGIWAECSANGDTPNVIPTPSDPGSVSLAPGTYSSLEGFENLIGCPFAGAWALSIVDLFGADNGWLFDWGIEFAPELLPQDMLSITPTLGVNDPDSAYWSGNGVVLDLTDPLTAQAVPTMEGLHGYTFTVMDDFGCAYTHQAVVEALDAEVEIIGTTTPAEGDIIQYQAEPSTGSFNWSVWGGSLITPQGASVMSVEWLDPANGWIMVHHTIGDCEASTILYMDVEIGIGEEQANALTAFPNPADGALNVLVPIGTRTLRLMDITGRIVKEQDVRMYGGSTQVLRTADLPSGTYFLEYAADRRSTVQVVIAH